MQVFHIVEFNITFLLCTYFHFSQLPFYQSSICNRAKEKLWIIGRKVQPIAIPSMSAFDIMGKHNKIVGITFWVIFINTHWHAKSHEIGVCKGNGRWNHNKLTSWKCPVVFWHLLNYYMITGCLGCWWQGNVNYEVQMVHDSGCQTERMHVYPEYLMEGITTHHR